MGRWYDHSIVLLFDSPIDILIDLAACIEITHLCSSIQSSVHSNLIFNFCSLTYTYVIQCVDFTRNSILFQVHYSTIRNHTQATIAAIPMVFFMPMQTVCGSLRVGLSDKLSYVPPLQNWSHGATGTDQNNFAVSSVIQIVCRQSLTLCYLLQEKIRSFSLF